MKRKLHIVSPYIPWPPDYGGAMDVYATIKALHRQGVEIVLHCFAYGGRKPVPPGQQFFTAIHYYKRKKTLPFRTPYIVASRKNEQLLNRLLEDDAPVLLEGIHCSWPVLDKRFSGRKMAVRSFNAEFEYYQVLAQNTRSAWKKWYYRTESRLLHNYERKVAQNTTIFAISEADAAIYRNQLGAADARVLPVAFEGSAEMPTGKGNYCLYHGNLSVAENEEAVLWLLEAVFPGVPVPLVIAGKNPSVRLEQAIKKLPGAQLKANCSEQEMAELAAGAHIHVLPAINSTGVKLKILYALYHGRFCITNTAGANGLNQPNLLWVGDNAGEWKTQIQELFTQSFTAEMASERRKLLEHYFSPEKQAEQLSAYLW
ncbi:MAG: glycosyltransferase family 4 protein [Dinghuibacter sp.]|nr:glycosyltransferase family 4 protein [Dinghuibacter sp.]